MPKEVHIALLAIGNLLVLCGGFFCLCAFNSGDRSGLQYLMVDPVARWTGLAALPFLLAVTIFRPSSNLAWINLGIGVGALAPTIEPLTVGDATGTVLSVAVLASCAIVSVLSLWRLGQKG